MKKYSDDLLRELVASSKNMLQVMRKLGSNVSGSMHAHLTQRIRKAGIDTSHFRKPNSGFSHRGGTIKRKSPGEILRVVTPEELIPSHGQLRRALVESGVRFVCNICQSPPSWREQPLVLQVDHIDGNRNDCRKENLRFLCPNCHSQTPTYGSKNSSTKRGRGCTNGIRFIEMVQEHERDIKLEFEPHSQ